jgi:hypothetical protein
MQCLSNANSLKITQIYKISLQEGVRAVLRDDSVGLRLLGLVLRLEFVGDTVVLLGEELLGLKSGNTSRSCINISSCSLLG